MVTTTQANILKAIAEFAYAIAKVDKYISDEEKQTFYEMLNQEFNKKEKIYAEQRFETLDEFLGKDVEMAYNQAIFLIRQNKEALTEDLCEKITNIMQKIAEVRGLLPEEIAWLAKFRADIISIYFEK